MSKIFFTVVTYNRQHFFKSLETAQFLRQSFHTVKQGHPTDYLLPHRLRQLSQLALQLPQS